MRDDVVSPVAQRVSMANAMSRGDTASVLAAVRQQIGLGCSSYCSWLWPSAKTCYKMLLLMLNARLKHSLL